jgi:hypothetical protein
LLVVRCPVHLLGKAANPTISRISASKWGIQISGSKRAISAGNRTAPQCTKIAALVPNLWLLPVVRPPQEATLYKSAVASEQLGGNFPRMADSKTWFSSVAE